MRIVIDMQGAQTESQFRGIGRYSLSLALAITRNARNHEIWLVLNSAFPESIVNIRLAFKDLIPSERIQIFDVPPFVAESYTQNGWRVRAAEKVREYFIQNLQPDFVVLTSLFEGCIDNAVTSIGSFAKGVNTAVVLYDLIPLLNPKIYLSTSLHKQYYYRKIESLKKAGLLLAISDYSRKSAIEALEAPPENVVSISTAVEPFFKPRNLSAEEGVALCLKYQLTRKIVLCVPGGFDARKNLERLINAYSSLSSELRNNYQLVISSKIQDTDRQILEKVGKKAGLSANELIITGYIPNDDLIALYNLACLFVFPSLCEGFGLPALEAMACGAPVIGASNTSIPEVIGRPDALFDATSTQSIADKITQVLNDEKFRLQLREHSLAQAKKFSWDEVAKNALQALEKKQTALFTELNTKIQSATAPHFGKPKLAFVAPLPPERTGIADYCAELLPELSHYFDLELITDQASIKLPTSLAHLPRRSVNWFRANGASYDRIIYQLGNSPFHTHMLELQHQYPGALVLHDFFLSSLLAYEEISAHIPGIWTKALLHSHGYSAVQARYNAISANEVDNIKSLYPCTLETLQAARGVIVHSAHAQQLATQWFGKGLAEDWNIIPLLRQAPEIIDRDAARKALGISDDAFVVCSFGLIDPTKLTHRLLQAWLSSLLHTNKNCELILVGANHGGDYGLEISDCIRNSSCKNRLRMTGWVDKAVYNQYLQAADVGVQLRSLSRGETSAAVLDCMNYGLATIANANGSMAELPTDAVLLLPDAFTDNELTIALEQLWQDHSKREQLASRARTYIQTKHSPSACTKQYVQALESIYQNTVTDQYALVQAIAALDKTPATEADIASIATSIANSNLPQLRQNQLLIDVTSIMRNDMKSGIERVVRAQLLELIKAPPTDYKIEPIYLSNAGGKWHYRYARDYTCTLLGISSPTGLENTPIDVSAQDVFYALDFAPHDIIQASKAGIFLQWRALGVQLNVLVYDLLPILKPEFFPKGADVIHTQWLTEITQFADRLIGISTSVADEVYHWLEQHPAPRSQPLKISAAPLGADITASAPTAGLPSTATTLLAQLKQTTSFLMVGTIEPRKGHLQALAAFDQLWQQNHTVTLVIIGREGWKQLQPNERRSIPNIVKQLSQHPAWEKQLFWLNEVSDEYLHEIYASSTCFLAPSEGEGFGLPLIEAAHYKLPIIARDLPVFREVAQQHAHYFSGLGGHELANAIITWLDLYTQKQAPTSTTMAWNTWAQNAQKLKSILSGLETDQVWTPALDDEVAEL